MKWMLKGSPLKVQQEALRRADRGRGWNHWLDTGLGKTPVSFNEFAVEYNEGRADYHVIVTLNSFRGGFFKEHDKWGAPGRYAVWPDERNLNQMKYEGCIINWEALIGSGGRALDEVMKHRKVVIHFDEAHKIKNPNSAVAKKAMELWKHSVMRRGNTATPMSVNVMDLYMPLRLATRLEGVNRFAFRNKYAEMGGFMGKKVVGIKEDRKDDLQKLIDSAAFRATKEEWTDLPPAIHMPLINLDLPPVLKKHYREMAQDYITFISGLSEDMTAVEANMVISQLGKLQQISSGFIHNEYGEAIPLCDPKEVPKWKSVIDVYEALQGRRKMIVFTNFVYSTSTLHSFLQETLGEPVAVMRGKKSRQPGEDPEQQKSWFNDPQGPNLMVAQLSVGGTAHTLLGDPARRCDTTFFAETTYNFIDRVQAEGRNRRIGQTLPVNYWDVASSPVEAAAVEAMQHKRDLIREVVDGAKRRAAGLSPLA